MSKTLTKEMIARAQGYEDEMENLRSKLRPYVNPVEDSIFGDVAYDLASNDHKPEEILEAEEDILDYLDEKNFSKIVSALHELFNRQKSMYLKYDQIDYKDWDYVDEDGNHYSTETQAGESYELYSYI